MASEASLNTGDGLSSYPNSFPELNPLDRYRIAAAEQISRITGADANLVFNSLDRVSNLEHGDLGLALPRLRIKGAHPDDLGKKIISEFEAPANAKLRQPVANGIHLQIEANHQDLVNTVIPLILKQKEKYGFNSNMGLKDPSNPGAGQMTMIVEFSSPNIAKKFHAGHLRSTIIGGFLSNLYEALGYNVVRLNYLGDWGRQYGLVACGWKRYGNEEIFAKDPIAHLFDIYVKISADFQPEDDAFRAAGKRGEDTSILESQGLLGEAKSYFKRMEDGDEEAIKLWRRFRELSIERYKETYAKLNIHFTDYSGESKVKRETMKKAEELLNRRGITEPDGGATIVDFKKHGAKKLDIAIIRNRNGTSNYLLRDIGAAIQRDETYHFDEMLYVVMSEQETHLNRLFKILDLMGGEYSHLSKRMKHITFGKVMGMSTRKGTVKFLDDILADVGDFMHDVMRRNEAKYNQVENPSRTAQILGISAIMVQDMSSKRINNYEFSLERMTSFEGDTGPYLQYAHARLCSIFRKAGIEQEELEGADFSLLLDSPHAINLLRLAARFPDMVNQTLKTLEPTTILTYLFQLTHSLSASYDHLQVVNPPEGRAVSVARAALYEATRQVIHNAMSLLGLTPVKRQGSFLRCGTI